MNKILKKSKGFSLVELLVVAVILCILFIIFTPLVIRIMNNSKQKSFKNEIVAMLSDFDKAYTEKSQNSRKYLYKVTVNDKSYFYLCMTLNDLVKEGYTNKNLNSSYGGYFQLWIADNGDKITFVNTTNGSIYLQGERNVITKSNFKATHINSAAIDAPNSESKCPKKDVIPDSSVYNEQDISIKDEIEEFINSKKK